MADMSDPVMLTSIGAVAAAGAGAIAKLWQQIQAHHSATATALQKCEDEHVKTHERVGTMFTTIAELSGKVGRLEGRIEGVQDAEKRRQERDNDRES